MGSDFQHSSSLAEELLERALRSRVEAAEVYQANARSRPVFFEANRLKQLEVSQSEGLALRIWRDGRPGLAVAYGPVDLLTLVDRAIALSQLNDPEMIEMATASSGQYPDLGQAVPVERLVDWGKEAIEQVRLSFPELLCSAEWECDRETTRLLNSEGLDCGYTDTTLSCYMEAELIRGDDFLSVADGQTRREHLDPIDLADQLLQRFHWAKGNVPPPTGRVPVLFTSKAADMLWSTVQSALNGKQVIERASPWSDRLGDMVVSPLITLTQNPEAGPYSCPFDDEGSPTQPITFLKEGMLQLFYTDRKIGRSLGSGTTGNAFRPGLESYPTPGLFNLLVQPGVKSFEAIIQEMSCGLIVDQMLGDSAGISGDFSINVEVGYAVQDGEILGRVKDTMVAGNVYTALKNVVEIGSDAVWSGECYTPSIMVEGLSVIGRGNN
ncbi:MAG: TldD/PmbA family protein [Cyanobacteria bacterium J06638_20]